MTNSPMFFPASSLQFYAFSLSCVVRLWGNLWKREGLISVLVSITQLHLTLKNSHLDETGNCDLTFQDKDYFLAFKVKTDAWSEPVFPLWCSCSLPLLHPSFFIQEFVKLCRAKFLGERTSIALPHIMILLGFFWRCQFYGVPLLLSQLSKFYSMTLFFSFFFFFLVDLSILHINLYFPGYNETPDVCRCWKMECSLSSDDMSLCQLQREFTSSADVFLFFVAICHKYVF